MYNDTEDALEQATLTLFRQMGWDDINCLDEVFGAGDGADAVQRTYATTITRTPKS